MLVEFRRSQSMPDYNNNSMIRLKVNDTSSVNYDNTNDNGGFISKKIHDISKKYEHEINTKIKHDNDYKLSYFGFKTLEKSYLLKTQNGTIVERPQYMLMRVALGIHCTLHANDDQEEYKNLQAAFDAFC